MMERIRVAAVQSGVDPRWKRDEWINHLRWQLAACHEARVELAVFPAWTGAFQDTFPGGVTEDELQSLVHILGDLALEAGLFLLPGTMPVRREDRVGLCSFLISPAGQLLGEQEQIQPPKGYAAGDRLSIIPTALGRVGIIIGTDAFIPEIGRILALQGADLYCVPQAMQGVYNPWRQAAGLWQVVQANQVPAVEACLTGEFCGLTFGGRSRVLGTVEMDKKGSGVLAEAKSATGTEIVAGEIDYAALSLARDGFPVFDQFNLDLYRRKLPEVYRQRANSGNGSSAPDSRASGG